MPVRRLAGRNGGVAAAAAVAAALCAAPPARATAPASASRACARAAVASSVVDERRALLCLVNASRRLHGLPPLAESARLDEAALLRAREIVRCATFSHDPCGSGFASVYRNAGLSLAHRSVAEDLAWELEVIASPASALRVWLASSPHRAALLGAAWANAGAAVLRTSHLDGRGAETIWVLELASPEEPAAPTRLAVAR